jgi:hypothetical protein
MADVRRFHTYLLLRQHLGWNAAVVDSLPDDILAAALSFIDPTEPAA